LHRRRPIRSSPILEHLVELLNDEHALRRLSNLVEAGQLRTMFANAQQLVRQLDQISEAELALRSLVAIIRVHKDQLEIVLKPAAVGVEFQSCWTWRIPRPARKFFREAKLRIDAPVHGKEPDQSLIALLGDACEVQKLVMASPDLGLNRLAKREGRCRKQLTRLLRLSFLSPRIVEAIIDGTQPRGNTRKRLLEIDLPVAWADQEELFGLAA
jgi:hypothetical protein